MPWKDDPSTGHFAGFVRGPGGDPVDRARVSASNPYTGEQRTQFTDGSGWHGFVDLAPGIWLVRAYVNADLWAPIRAVSVTAGELDRRGFELRRRWRSGQRARRLINGGGRRRPG